MVMKSSLILVAAAALAFPAVAAEPVNTSPVSNGPVSNGPVSNGPVRTSNVNASPVRFDHVRQVQFSDLNLETDAGRTALDRRLDRAVKSICAVNPVLESQGVAEAQAQCEAETRAPLHGQVDAAVRANRARAARTAGL